jgi:tRNA-2-methylthio-N6-dimethylallyladenosine synthase
MASEAARAGSYYIETWGCQMNVHDSEKLAGALEMEGLFGAASPEQADVLLLNTCSIRERAAEKVFSKLGRLRRLKKRRPGMLIGVCGCVAQQEGERLFARAPHVDFVLGPRATGSLREVVARLRAGDVSAHHSIDLELRSDSVDFPFSDIRRRAENPAKAYVTVNEGCNHRCTYCVVPSTRGREICREMTAVMEEVGELARQGRIEIEFLGQTVNAYRDSAGNTLADLLLATAGTEGISRIRFTTSHPAQMTDGLMDAMAAASPTVCPYLHLPAQSGSSKVLRDMRRGYDREGYLAKIAGLRKRMPEMLFGTDIIVGFPTETEEDFELTLSLLDEVRFDTVYSFAYSPRPGTKALELGDALPVDVKMERLHKLQERQKKMQEKRNREMVGRRVEVLVEGHSKRDGSGWTGRTPEHRIVNFAGTSAAGRLESIKIVDSSAFSLRGELVICCP